MVAEYQGDVVYILVRDLLMASCAFVFVNCDTMYIRRFPDLCSLNIDLVGVELTSKLSDRFFFCRAYIRSNPAMYAAIDRIFEANLA